MNAYYPRKRRRKRKCKLCLESFMPDARHFRDQKFCSRPECRKASKHASQRRWYYSPKGAVHRDPEYNKQRVREWRAEHPDYARLTGGRPRQASASPRKAKPSDGKSFAPIVAGGALQDSTIAQHAMVKLVTSILAANALQETIVIAAWDFVHFQNAHSGDQSKERQKVNTVFAKARNGRKTEEIDNHVWHI